MSDQPIKQDAATLIALIKQLIDRGADVDAFLDPLHRLIALSPSSIGWVADPGLELYRVTKHHTTLPTRIDEVWFPPPELTPSGRANRPNQPMFYCTSDPSYAYYETSITVGQTVVFSKWVTTARMMLHDLGYTAQVLARAGSTRTLPEPHRKFYEDNLTDEGRQIRDFIAMRFTDPNPNSYAFTNAVAEFHLDADFDLAGILYPAATKAANADNLALRPSFVREGMKLVEATLQEVSTVTEDGYVVGDIQADLVDVRDTGELSWSLREPATSSPPGSSIAVSYGEAIRVHDAADLEIGGREFHVEPGYAIVVSKTGDFRVLNLKGEKVEPSA